MTTEFLKKHPQRPLIETKVGDQPDVCLNIDWQFSDTVLLKWMRLILEEKRPRDAKQGKGRPKELDTALKSLGAFRFLKLAKLNIAQATEYSKNHRKGAFKIPLYVDQAEWSKASATVEKIITGFADEMAKLTRVKPI
ncbi:MAG: hypothetical protein GY922_02095 [Proteobacteria bacterium]|nr:hypothetical protein [Pseudomonadota bacterium]